MNVTCLHLKSRLLIAVAALVGVISGIAAFIFYLLMDLCTKLFLWGLGGYNPPSAGGELEIISFDYQFGTLPIYLIPAIGGLLSGLIVYTFAPEAEGHGTDAVIRSFHKLRGFIRGRVPIVKGLASAITIGSGGSAGREGPIVQMGAGIGSYIASKLGFSDRDRRILLICGTAGGIGAIFHSPLGGAIFGIEILYRRDYEVEALVPAFTSSVVAYAVFEMIMGYIKNVPFGAQHVFITPSVAIHSPLEMVIYFILGIIAGLVGLLYIRCFYTVHDFFKSLKISPYIKPAIGGLITGLIGYLFLVFLDEGHPFVLGMGYGYVQMAMEGKLALYVIILIILGKIIATSFTIGSGGSGGVFAPSIVIGSMVGGAVGIFFHQLFPNIVTQPEAYVLVGMGAFVAGVAKTPMAAIIMVLEMTGGYNLLPALMLASVVSYKVTWDRSIYIEQVPTRIESPAHRAEMLVDVLENVTVREAMLPVEKVVTVSPENTILEVMQMIERTGHMGYPVIEDGKLVGIIAFEDVEKLPVEKRSETKVKDVMTTNLIVTYPDESLEDALKKLAINDIGRLPVVDRHDGRKLLGMLTRSDIMKAHAREVTKLGK